jgi:hypothetical protein
LGYSTESIFGSWPSLHHEDPDSLSAGDATEPIGHIHADSLLPTDDRSQSLFSRYVYQ